METNTTTAPVPPTVDKALALKQLEAWEANTAETLAYARKVSAVNPARLEARQLMATAQARHATAWHSLAHYRASNPAV